MGKRAPHHLELTNASARVLDCTKADFLSPAISSSTLAAKGKPGGKHFQERPPGSASQSVPPPAPINASLRKIPAQARPARSPGKAQGLQRARQNILPHRSTQLTTPAERGLKWGREKEMTQEPFSSGRLRYPGSLPAGELLQTSLSHASLSRASASPQAGAEPAPAPQTAPPGHFLTLL